MRPINSLYCRLEKNMCIQLFGYIYSYWQILPALQKWFVFFYLSDFNLRGPNINFPGRGEGMSKTPLDDVLLWAFIRYVDVQGRPP